MVARVAALQQGVLLSLAFHVGAGQIVKQHVELSPKQFAVATFQMLLQFRLVRKRNGVLAVQEVGATQAQERAGRGREKVKEEERGR